MNRTLSRRRSTATASNQIVFIYAICKILQLISFNDTNAHENQLKLIQGFRLVRTEANVI